ncbi:hypothetical protein ElyMa_001558200 [Elysia marginata]|uniref:Uncharacterized protein n=1 Tax=Elysia marginata TaxID=1093978 RepID=A0AAV4JEU5_9GAST|nr:hypothetical protein ElyMa_001558200 [Elysia marginata]
MPELPFSCNFPIHAAVCTRVRNIWFGVHPYRCVDGRSNSQTNLEHYVIRPCVMGLLRRTKLIRRKIQNGHLKMETLESLGPHDDNVLYNNTHGQRKYYSRRLTSRPSVSPI